MKKKGIFILDKHKFLLYNNKQIYLFFETIFSSLCLNNPKIKVKIE